MIFLVFLYLFDKVIKCKIFKISVLIKLKIRIKFSARKKKPNLIYNTLLIDNDGDELNERYLTNFLLFGCLGLNTLKKLIQSDEMVTKEEVKLKEESLDDVLFELTVDDCSNDVTFSQVIKQYLNLSTRIDNLGQVLALIVGIVNLIFFKLIKVFIQL